MTQSSTPPENSSEPLPEWATPSRAVRRPERAGGYVQLAFGLVLVVASLAIIGLEAWQILTQPSLSTDETVFERLAWPLLPGIFGVSLLVERWYDQRSSELR